MDLARAATLAGAGRVQRDWRELSAERKCGFVCVLMCVRIKRTKIKNSRIQEFKTPRIQEFRTSIIQVQNAKN